MGTYAMNLIKENFENTNTNYENVIFVVEDGSIIFDTIASENEIKITYNYTVLPENMANPMVFMDK